MWYPQFLLGIYCIICAARFRSTVLSNGAAAGAPQSVNCLYIYTPRYKSVFHTRVLAKTWKFSTCLGALEECDLQLVER